MAQILTNLIDRLSQRRTNLGMSHNALAMLSGVSEPTVKRILGGRIAGASFANVLAIAEALGIPVTLAEIDVDAVCEQQARMKAERIARMVQGSSGLEGQAVDRHEYQRLVERSVHELMAGSRRRLWSA